MSETKTFGIGAVLSITSEAMVCDIGEIYEILGWLTNEPGLMTHQLPRAARESEDFLREQFPDLAAVDMPKWSEVPGWEAMGNEAKKAVISEWLDDLASRLGATREVPRLPAEDHTSIDPIAEIKMIRPDLPIITLRATAREEGEQDG